MQPLALEMLKEAGIPVGDARSKSWAEFAGDAAPEMDLVITVCDKAAGEACPHWPGQPMTAHWGVNDPVSVEGDEATKRRAFADAMNLLRYRIGLLLSLQPEALDRLTLERKIRDIGARTDVNA